MRPRYGSGVRSLRRATRAPRTCSGVLYEEGQGVPQDYAEAVKWFQLAADQGLAIAQNNLGAMYYNGQGVPQDYVQAHK
jgi:uncharacterized protein